MVDLLEQILQPIGNLSPPGLRFPDQFRLVLILGIPGHLMRGAFVALGAVIYRLELFRRSAVKNSR